MYFIAVKKTRPLSVREGGKGVSFVILTKCDSKGVLFLSKLVYKRARGWTSGRSPPPPCEILFTPPGQYPPAGDQLNCAYNSAFYSKYKNFTKHISINKIFNKIG